MILDVLPETSGIRVGGRTLENHLSAAAGKRTVGNVSVSRDPADVGGAPEYVVILEVEGPLGGQDGMQQVAPGRVLYAFRLAGRARGVEQE